MRKTYTEQDLYNVAPSVFAEAPSGKVSANYQFVPTIDAIRSIQSAGFNVVDAKQCRTRDENNRPFAKHFIRLAPAFAPRKVGDVTPEILLINSHNGSSSFTLNFGLYRLVCSNGMVVGTSLMAGSRITHSTKGAADIVAEQSLRMIESTETVLERVERFQSLTLTGDQSQEFTRRAAAARWSTERVMASVTNAAALAHVRRDEDRGTDFWTVFNRVQESLIRGGVHVGARRAVRGIKGAQADYDINRRLWDIGEAFFAETVGEPLSV